ncbi:MAG: IPT/TIG domain-containing protein, partial [Planctomycetota bacterium]
MRLFHRPLRTLIFIALCASLLTCSTKRRTQIIPYTPAVVVSTLQPDRGPLGGGNTVRIFGIDFQAGATVTFGGVDATSVVFVSDQLLTCIAPPGTALGPFDVAVTVPDGRVGLRPGGYTYTHDRWWHEAWPARRAIQITPSTADLVDFQVPLVLPPS